MLENYVFYLKIFFRTNNLYIDRKVVINEPTKKV